MNKFLLLLLLLPSVAAIQLSPASHELVLEPGATSEYPLRIINDGRQSFTVSFAISAPFDEHIRLAPDTVSFTPQDAEKSVTLILTHPDEALLLPGMNKLQVRLSSQTEDVTQFSGAITLVHNLNLIRLYEGAYLDATIENENDIVAILITNLGQAITSASASGTISDIVSEKSLTFPSKTFLSGENGKLQTTLDIPSGEYNVSVLLRYRDPVRGNITAHLNKTIRNGAPAIRIGKPRGQFTPNILAEIMIPLTLNWNQQLSVYADIELEGNSQRTPTLILSPRKQHNFSGVVDLTGLSAGNYTLHIKVYSEGLLLSERTDIITVDVEAAPSLLMRASHPIFLLILLVLLCSTLLILAILLIRKQKK